MHIEPLNLYPKTTLTLKDWKCSHLAYFVVKYAVKFALQVNLYLGTCLFQADSPIEGATLLLLPHLRSLLRRSGGWKYLNPTEGGDAAGVFQGGGTHRG